MIRKVVMHEDYSGSWEEALALQALFYQVLSCHARINTASLKDMQTGSSGNAFQRRACDNIQAAAHYMEQNYSRPITMQNVAAYVNFSENYLCSVFKQKYGMSPKQYLITYRIEMARHILKTHPELSVGEVAESCGFADPLYFTKVFHKRIGLTPTEYRKGGEERE